MKINGFNKNSLYENAGWVVSRYIDNELWFWGVYCTKERALEVANEVDGIVISMEELRD